mgnify:CR=1 FL=1
MNENTRQELLKISNRWEFEEKLFDISNDYCTNIDLWDEELIKHYLKIADMSMKEFEWSFELTPPIDDFDEE